MPNIVSDIIGLILLGTGPDLGVGTGQRAVTEPGALEGAEQFAKILQNDHWHWSSVKGPKAVIHEVSLIDIHLS